MKKTNGVIWGIVLVAAGVILALNAFNITNLNIFFDGWWTLLIIIPSIIGLFTNRDKGSSAVGICVGVFLLLCCQDVLSFDMFWKLLIPVVIVVVGLKMILTNAFGNKSTEAYKRIMANGVEMKNSTATFSGTTMNLEGEAFEGAELNAIFGSVKCDLHGAVIEKDCVINASSIFGGIDIYVPDNLNVKINSNSAFGGVSNKRRSSGNPDSPTVYVNATCMFGGVEIK